MSVKNIVMARFIYQVSGSYFQDKLFNCPYENIDALRDKNSTSTFIQVTEKRMVTAKLITKIFAEYF